MPQTTTPSRLGQVNAAGDAKALFLKKFAGEILTAFHDAQVMMDKHLVRTIENGKSASFPATGTATAGYHTPGQNILDGNNSLLNSINHNEVIVNIDDLLIAATFIANIDEAMNHYDVRSIYSTELGQALAQAFDKNVLQRVLLSARVTTPNVTGGLVGTKLLKGPAVETDPRVLAKAIAEAVQKLYENKTPQNAEIFAAVRPAQYMALVQDDKILSKNIGGSGSYSDGKVLRISGAQIVMTNNLPSTNIAAKTGENNTYSGDFTSTVAAVWTKDAVGTVKLLDLATENDYKVEYQGTLFVAKYAMGHGTLRPERAVEISKASA